MFALRVTINDGLPTVGGCEKGAFSVILSAFRTGETEARRGWGGNIRFAGLNLDSSHSMEWLSHGFSLDDTVKIEVIDTDSLSPETELSPHEEEANFYGESPLLAFEAFVNNEVSTFAGFGSGSVGLVVSVVDKWNKNDDSVRRFTNLSLKGEEVSSSGEVEYRTWWKKQIQMGDVIQVKFIETCFFTPPEKISAIFSG